MRTSTSRSRVSPPRSLNLLTAAILSAGLLNAACGSTATPTSTTNAARPSPAAVQPEGIADWPGFRGDASRSAVGLQGPTGNPVLNWQFKAGGADRR